MKERDHRRETAVAELDRALADAVLTGREERSVTALRGQDALAIQGVTQLLWAVRLAEATQLTTGHRSPVVDLCSPDPGVPVPMPPGTEVERRGQILAGDCADRATFRREVCRRLRDLRIRDDLSQRELATRAGVTRNFIGGVERGVQHLDAWRLRLLSRALHIPPGLLLGEPADAGGVRR